MSLTSAELARVAGLTYRRVDYWTRRGWLHADQDWPGSGTARAYPPSEALVALLLGTLTAGGLRLDDTLADAARTARVSRDDGTFQVALGALVVSGALPEADLGP